MSVDFAHRPVLHRESLSWLGLRASATVVDGTLGGGGHAEAILEATAPDGRLIGLDVDEEAVRACAARLAPFGARAVLISTSFRNLRAVLVDLGIDRIDAVLLDLGVSSPQLDRPERGFRFAAAGAEETPLDMRMDRRGPLTAADLLRDAPVEELAALFRDYGQLRGAGRLARHIDRVRQRAPLRTAADLLDAVRAAGVGGGRRHHPATLVFQALRMRVNDELPALAEGLEASVAALRPGGRLVVIAYHSLEDRMVKHRLRDEARGCVCPPGLPVCQCGRSPRLRVLTRRPIRPGEDEVRDNPRARSARLRAAERIPEAA